MTPVMLVDDEPAIQETVELVLLGRGISLNKCLSGKECLDRMRAGFKGVLLMDIMMPGMDGWATLRALEKEQLLNGSAVIMLTAVTEPGSAGQGLECLVLDYLTKPFSPDELLDVVTLAQEELGS